jgi:predicted TIM-barrel fold metal-dependent hydrolase
LFSIDYPYENMAQGADWFDNITELTDEEMVQVASSNAKRVLKLPA